MLTSTTPHPGPTTATTGAPQGTASAPRGPSEPFADALARGRAVAAKATVDAATRGRVGLGSADARARGSGGAWAPARAGVAVQARGQGALAPHANGALGHAGRRAKADSDATEKERARVAADPLDPETRRCAQLAPPSFVAPTPAAPAPDAEIAPRARVSMEELLPQLVKRIAWAGDKRRGSVQMELGAGPHAGTVITIHADDGKVRVELAGDPCGTLRDRLEAKGFAVER